MKTEEIIKELQAALAKARKKHPAWPTDIIHAATIVAEELGELQQAALQCVYEGGNIEQVKKEAFQSGAMIIRFLSNIERYIDNDTLKME